MTPVTPNAPPDIQERLASVAQTLITIGGALGMFWAFLAKVAKPWIEWRRKSIARTVREAIGPELKAMEALIAREETCAEGQEKILRRQNKIFDDVDTLLIVALDNRDRLDEFGQLLDAVGFDSDRRTDSEKRKQVDGMLSELRTRRKQESREDPT